MRKINNIFYIVFLIILLGCSSSSQVKTPPKSLVQRPFLNEYKKFALTYGAGNSVYEISLDGKGEFCYISREEAGNVDIFVIDTYTLKKHRLTKNPAIDSSPSVDSKLRYLVFSSTRDDAFSDIYIYNFNAYYVMKKLPTLENFENSAKRLTDYKGLDKDPQVAHDANLIAFVSDRWENTPTVHTMTAAGKNIKRITDIPAQTPVFSFDDNRVAFVTMNVGETISQIAMTDIGGVNTKILTDTKTLKFNPSFYNDDIILYFEIERDTDGDNVLTYSDEKRLMAYSINLGKTYVVENKTELTKFYVPYQSSTLGAFLSYKEGTLNAQVGNTKEYFIKDALASEMYNTFVSLPYEKKLSSIERFPAYFPSAQDENFVASAYMRLMTEAYTNGNYKDYLYAKHILLKNHKYTEAGITALSIERMTFKNTLLKSNTFDEETKAYIRNMSEEEMADTNTFSYGYESISNMKNEGGVWARYIVAKEIRNDKTSLVSSKDILKQGIENVQMNKNQYMTFAELYSKILIDDGVSLYDSNFTSIFNRADLNLKDKFDLAKMSISYASGKGLNHEILINELPPSHPLSIQSRLMYTESLLLVGYSEYAKDIFEVYRTEKDQSLLSVMSYGLGKIDMFLGKESAYSFFEDSLKRKSDFLITTEADEAKKILAAYYLAIGDSAYDRREYTKAYDNYNISLSYNPEDSFAARRSMETGLRGSPVGKKGKLDAIDRLEKTVYANEKMLLSTKYSDPFSHIEIATAYYYLANMYYNHAMENATGKNRYILSQKRRQDGFSLYLMKAFETIINDAVSAIDVAIFLSPDTVEYYIFKAQMLSTAMAMRIEVKAENKRERSLLDLVSIYSDDSLPTPNPAQFGRFRLSSDTLESDILSALIEAKRQVIEISKDGNPQISLMLANAYMINGRYSEAAEEYKEAEKYINKADSLKEKAWYHFFYGYCLWINGYPKETIEQYEKAYNEFITIKDDIGMFRVLGYLSVAYLDAKDYTQAVKYLKDRETLLVQNKIDTTLNDLLLATCYLKSNNYGMALEYCDKAKPNIDKLNSNVYTDNYITISVFGSVTPIVNMGLAAFGGYIPDEPLNVDKKEMLYSLYQEAYEKSAMYSEARTHLEEYKNITTRDKTKKDIHPVFLSMYKNNEGALYYMEGQSENAAKAFENSISEYAKSIKQGEDRFKNAQNDAINYINLASIYLDIISDSENADNSDKLKSFSEINKMLPDLNMLSTNTSINKKNRLLLHTHIAAINYTFAKFSANVFTNRTSFEMHNDNIERIDRIKTAVKHYRYILSPEAALPIDIKTEVVVAFNLGLCYEFMGNITEAAREYTAAYSKASKNALALEEISILATMMEFSRKYYSYGNDLFFKPEIYAKMILTRLRNTSYAFALYPQSRFILSAAKNALLNHYKNEKPETLIEIATLFDIVSARTSILQNQKRTYNEETDKYLLRYYEIYNNLVLEYQKYTEETSEAYSKNAEKDFIAKLKEAEKNTFKEFEKTPISTLVLGNVNKNTIKNLLRKNETLIWDISRTKRIVIQNGKTEEIATNALPKNLSEYITHIGFRDITNMNVNEKTFVRRFTGSSPYITPEICPLFDNEKYALYYKGKTAVVSETTNTGAYSNVSAGDNQSLIYAVSTNDAAAENIQFKEGRNKISALPKSLKYINITNAANMPYVPFVLDMSGSDIKVIESFAQKQPYILYIDRMTYQSNRQAVSKLNPYVMIIGADTNAKRMFYTNYLLALSTNSVENVMKGSDTKMFSVYGKSDFNPKDINKKIDNFQNILINKYSKSAGRTKLEAMTNLIWYADTLDKKLLYSKIILEDLIKNGRTNIAYNAANSTYAFFTNTNPTNFVETNAYAFMKTALSFYNSFSEHESFTNASRVVYYLKNYSDTADSLVSNYVISPMNVIRYTSRETDAKKVVEYLDLITPHLKDRSYGQSFMEYAVVYKTLYAGNPLEKSEDILSELSNKEELITTLETLKKPINTLTEKDVFSTMNYLYSKPFIFKSSTIEEFADKYYSLYKTNAPYIFGLLEKRRYSTPEFDKYIIDTQKVFENEDTNSLFCFYAVEGGKYTAYLYAKGYPEVKRYKLGTTNNLHPLLKEYTNVSLLSQREKTIQNIQKEVSDKQMLTVFSSASNVYIAGTFDVYNVPFAFFKLPNGKYFDNAVKVRSIKYGERDILRVKTEANFVSADNNFYSSLERKALSYSFNLTQRNNEFTHYRGNTNVISNFTKDLFLSPAQRQTINRYLRDEKEYIMLYTYAQEEKGDYFTTMKSLYINLAANDIISSYKNARFGTNVIPSIKNEDNNIRYGANMLFDYILPYIPENK